MSMKGKEDRSWVDTLSVPWDIADMWPDSNEDVTKCLVEGFEEIFGIRPVDVEYCSYPDGLFAILLIHEEVVFPYNLWGLVIASRLRHAGVNISVAVRASYPVVLPEPRRENTSGDVCQPIGGDT